ncbi:MAG TPA: hypothetical protein IAB17_05070 [Candidatus Alectryocaccobium stercorigallinarum]|nr:hypothetical protein [Candidatus Alectryocaccobium stercorigallinarum]
MIKWHSRIYLEEKVRTDYDKIRALADEGKCASGIYFIALSSNPDEQLDIFSAHMFRSSLEVFPDPVVVGLASGKEEAEELVSVMALDALEAVGTVDFRKYFEEL